MKVQTEIKAGALTSNHNQTLVRRIILVNHNQTVKSRIVTNHNQTLIRRGA